MVIGLGTGSAPPGKHHGSNMAQPEKIAAAAAAAAGLSMVLFPKGLQKGIINTLMIFL
jgi:hypothetical protein